MDMTGWHDIDTATSFDLCCSALRDRNARSFAVRFNTQSAFCVLNPDQQGVEALLQSTDRNDGPKFTRWLNFWDSGADVNAIKTIAQHYGVTPRLTALLCANGDGPSAPSISQSGQSKQSALASATATANPQPDVEKAFIDTGNRTERAMDTKKLAGFGDVVDDLWHFCSVDRGPEYIYVGFNALHTLPGQSGNRQAESSKPHGLRIWTSLLLCYDGTIVSITEKPPSDISHAYLSMARLNVTNIFKHLSRLHASTSVDTLMQVNVRQPPSDNEKTSTVDAESSALLFYYLFDDWRATYSLISQRHNPYRDQLKLIRQDMFEAANMDLIRSLDIVGRQLTGLKLMYQSYELIIHRVLRHSSTRALGAATSLSWSDGNSLEDRDETPALFTLDAYPTTRQTGLPPSTVVRFERLLDRIRLYALTEIDECLKQKESLVLMNFNLVALKESQAVERLTRTTILLAKVTILFLPVSLMTGYFSIQVAGIASLYSLKTYWICFLVVAVASILGLVLFGITAGSIGGATTYKSSTRLFWDRVRRGKIKAR